MNSPTSGVRLAALRSELKEMVRSYGHEHRARPFRLSSGGMSHDYIDGKRAIARGSRLQIVGEAVVELAREAGIEFDAVGGMTMGADPIALATAIAGDKRWFSVRKEQKEHGKQRRIEGAELAPGTRVVIVEDAMTTGRSSLEALAVLQGEGVEVVMVTPLVDRGEVARPAFEELGVRFEPLVTYKDLGIDPVG